MQQLFELESRLDKIKRNLGKSHSMDFAEQAAERENDQVLEEIARETTETIGRLKAALKRIDEGTYGTCESCGEKISAARLKALPDATLCISCAT